MDSGIEPVVEPITMIGAVSGDRIIDTICDQVAESLARSCNLRAVDSYRSFGGRVTIDLQLVDLDTVNVTEEITIGTTDPAQPTQRIVVDVPVKRNYISRVRGTK